MAQDTRVGTWVKMIKVAVAPIAGAVVYTLLLPIGWVETPPMCESVFGYRVPCGSGPSLLAGAATAAVVGFAFWPWLNVVKTAVSLIAGVVVLLLLLPSGGVDTLPPTCWSVFGYEVPCNANLSYAAGGATAGLVGFAFWLHGRRGKHKK